MRDPSQMDTMRRQQAEETLLRHAAAEIVRQDQEDFFAAQDLPDPPPELLARVDAAVYRELRKGGGKRRMLRRLANFGKAAAVLVLISGSMLTLGYVSVDATREKINAFLLENFGTHVVVHTEETDEGTGNTVPLGWTNPVRPTWIPKRFDSVKTSSAGRSDFLRYISSETTEVLLISIWPSSVAPYWDAESMDSTESIIVQNVSANLCYKNDVHSYLLRFTQSDVTVQIVGSLTREEIIKIAENISF